MITWPLTWDFYESASLPTPPVQVPIPKGETSPWCRIHQLSAQSSQEHKKKCERRSHPGPNQRISGAPQFLVYFVFAVLCLLVASLVEDPWCQVLIEVQTDEKSYEEGMFYCSVEMKVGWGSPSLRHGMLNVQPQTVVSHSCIPREAEVSPEGRASFPRKNAQDTKAKWFLEAPIAFHWLHGCLNGWFRLGVTLCQWEQWRPESFMLPFVWNSQWNCVYYSLLCAVWRGTLRFIKDKCFISL